ncbi:porin [Spiribacter halobius]|uniref:Porin domain-containing protein n=1 Tax=Sediminicurvatus halobius TaxID=2182432 RepID=A0A2U2MWZ6_9GAMM|nr:porin [Spiribacter halobius]PWG61388.1 hypothetical protein DEM34_16590 [Spiribacter halobius]UEX78555.1 porin [Spiribacter halobius]
MMKKTASALAVAALMGTGAASAATFQVNDDTTLSLYGNVQIAYSDTNDASGDSVSDLQDNGTTIGVAVEHRFDNGLTGFARIEEDGYDAVEQAAETAATDQAYFGVRGDFGMVRLGNADSIYDGFVRDYWDYQEFLAPINGRRGVDHKDRQLLYMSPNFGGFSFGLEAQINGDADEATFELTQGGVNNGDNETGDVNGDDAGISLAAAAMYETGGLTVSAAIDQRSNEFVSAADAGSEGGPNHFDDPVMGIVVSYDFGRFTVDGGYQLDAADTDERAIGDVDVLSLGGRFNYGMGDLYGIVQEVGYDEENAAGNDSFTEVILGANYNIGSNFYVYAEYATYDQEEDANDGFAIGGLYSF